MTRRTRLVRVRCAGKPACGLECSLVVEAPVHRAVREGLQELAVCHGALCGHGLELVRSSAARYRAA